MILHVSDSHARSTLLVGSLSEVANPKHTQYRLCNNKRDIISDQYYIPALKQDPVKLIIGVHLY